MKERERINELFEKHGYAPMSEMDFQVDVLLKFMCVVMDELKIDEKIKGGKIGD